MTVYRCEDSLEGVFTAVYRAYEERRDPRETQICTDGEPMLFAEDVAVEPDREKTGKVMNTLIRRFGEEDYLFLCLALTSGDSEKAQAVYRTVADGLRRKAGPGHLFDNLADRDVNRAFRLARGADRELAHMRGFLRFQELENGVLYARVGMKNNLLTFLMPHFADRLPMENFMIYDEGRGLFGIHPAGGRWYLRCGETDFSPPGLSEEELRCRELFKGFCQTLTIGSRRNEKLQKSVLPLRFREYMTEFEPD